MDRVSLSKEFVDQLVVVVKRVLRAERGQQPHSPRHGAPAIRRKQGILNTGLPAASDGATAPTNVTARDVRRNPSTGELYLTGNETSITHRFENIEVAADTFVAYEYLDGEWSLYKVDCAPMGNPLS